MIPVAFVAPTQPDRVRIMLDLAKEHPNLELDVIDPSLPTAEQITRCAPHEIMILGTRVTMEVLDACPHLRFVQLMSAGFDTFDIGALHARGIQFANSSEAIAVAVAEHTIALMLAAKHRLADSWLAVQHGRWTSGVNGERISELSGSTVGLVGLGRIGREVAVRLRGWGVNLLYTDITRAPAEVEEQLGATWTGLEDMLAASDVVSLHVPLNASTHHLISDRELRQMKPSAILVNTCRGPVVDEAALVRALEEGVIAFAALDVLEVEPAAADNPLLRMENALVTPHIAGSTVERVRRATAFALENVERVVAGQPPLSLVTD